MDYFGGCQCGAIRYRAEGPRDRASVCYCRMCQRASGGPFMAFVRFPAEQVSWSKPPAIFASSNIVERGFCPDCGTPLTYRKVDSGNISLTLHSLDDPAAVTPDRSFSPEMRASWCLALDALPVEPTPEAAEPGFVSHQRPEG
jgi:hypothetical protein